MCADWKPPANPDPSDSVAPWIPYYGSTIEGRYGFLLRLFFSVFFSRVRLLSEDVRRVQELSAKGTIVYVLKSRSDLESLLYHYQCGVHGLPVPVFATDSHMTIFHSLGFALKTMRRRLAGLRRRDAGQDPYASGFIKQLVRCGQSIILYLQDMEAFTKRFLLLGRDPFVQILEVQQEQERPIYMIPQMVIWDRARERLHPRLDELLFGARANPSDLRVAFNFLRFYRKDTHISQAQALDLKGFLDANAGRDLQEVALELRQELLGRLWKERRVATGPVVHSRQEIMERVLLDERVQQAIQRRIKRGNPPKAVRKEAYRLFREIAADYDPKFLKFWDWILTWAVRHLYDGLEVDHEGLERVREAARGSNLVLVPCHKSHMDYLILAYVFYRNRLFPPFTAAGLNLAFWPMGFLFRKSGAFFIRRDFRGSTLYPAIFTRYLHVLLEEGYPLEFFIEGGRSRSGKLILPKLGFLSLLMEGYRAGACKDISFVPAAIAYERVMEESAYLREVEGGEKPKESFWEIWRSRQAIRKRYGKIYVTFNEPVSLRAYLARTLENPASAIRYTRQNVSDYLGYELAQRINQVVMVVPTNLAAAAILSASLRGASSKEVLRVGHLFYGALQDEGARFSSSLNEGANVPRVFRETLDLFEREKLIQRMGPGQGGDEEGTEEDALYAVQDRNRRQLDYYKNTILHYLLPSAFVSASLLSAGGTVVAMERILADVAFLRDFFRQEFVFLPEEDVEGRIGRILKRMMERGLVRSMGHGFAALAGRRPDLVTFARLIQSYFESYFVVGSSLKAIANRRLSERRFLWSVRLTAHRFYQTGKIRLPESLSQVNFGNAIQYLVDQKIVVRQMDRSFMEGTYYSLNRERRPIHWRRLKAFLRIYT
jgi:glycerol-3-phosphate O-acyltransferase